VCLLFAFLVLTAMLFGAGVALHALWLVLLVLIVMWLIGFLIAPRRRNRWQR
jgi:type II secretory pathway component PulF